jgi:GNAT superfamily N-acetyltransferase
MVRPLSDLAIREARVSDSPAIAGLVTQLGYPTSGEEMAVRLGAILARPEHILLIAETDGSIVGLVGANLALGLELNGPYGRLTGLVVDEAWRGQGIGEELMQAVEDWLLEHGASMSLITSGLHRDAAHTFYRRLGYQQTGYRFAKRLY